ncbi:HAD-IIB family hydrolase [Luteococcus sp. H138]|uniref:HAD-IIB family hydrolase n=1 Tax=unclassified Luteococcus TaxID=2639923 RepID=UPI00313EC201
MHPSLVATDLDGTFLGADGRASQRNVDAMLRAADLGIPVVVATGRPARWLDVLDPIRAAHPYVLSSNGAAVYDLAAGELVETFPVPADLCLDVAREMRAICPEIVFGLEYGLGWAREEHFPLRPDHVEAEAIGDISQLVATRPFVKMLVISERHNSDELAQQLMPVCDDRLTCTWSLGGPLGLLEVSALGVSKASTLTRLAQELSVDLADAVAFGDMPNDLEMLHAVGHGYAMADAHPLLLAAGFGTAGSHDDSGVGRTLEGLFDAL